MRSADPRLLGAFAWWGFDVAVLWAMLNAFGAPPPLAVVVLAYFVGQVANTIPIPGAVSGGLVGVLLAFGVDADLALAAVLAYRAIAIWLPGADRARRARRPAPHDRPLGPRGCAAPPELEWSARCRARGRPAWRPARGVTMPRAA